MRLMIVLLITALFSTLFTGCSNYRNVTKQNCYNPADPEDQRRRYRDDHWSRYDTEDMSKQLFKQLKKRGIKPESTVAIGVFENHTGKRFPDHTFKQALKNMSKQFQLLRIEKLPINRRKQAEIMGNVDFVITGDLFRKSDLKKINGTRSKEHSSYLMRFTFSKKGEKLFQIKVKTERVCHVTKTKIKVKN